MSYTKHHIVYAAIMMTLLCWRMDTHTEAVSKHDNMALIEAKDVGMWIAFDD